MASDTVETALAGICADSSALALASLIRIMSCS